MKAFSSMSTIQDYSSALKPVENLFISFLPLILPMMATDDGLMDWTQQKCSLMIPWHVSIPYKTVTSITNPSMHYCVFPKSCKKFLRTL